MKVSDRTYFVLKRLHSLTGVFPIGVFLLEHFYTNSQALQGPGAFDRAAADLAGIPYVGAVEAFGIWLPILFHIVLGVFIATTSQPNLRRYGYAKNWMYTLQRLSGIVLIFYILFHTFQTRFDPKYLESPSPFQYMREQLSSPAMFWFMVVGILSACWHFGNGLFGFSIHWGLATGRTAQRNVAKLGLVVSVVLAIVALNSLLAFTGRGFYPDWLTKPHAQDHAVVLERGGR